MKGKEAYDKIFDKLTYDQQQELGEEVLRTVYQDLNRLEKLEKENQELKNTILSLELDTCIPKLRQENNDLKKVIKILKKKFHLYTSLHFDGENFYYWLDYETDLTIFTLKLTKEEYTLIREVLGND